MDDKIDKTDKTVVRRNGLSGLELIAPLTSIQPSAEPHEPRDLIASLEDAYGDGYKIDRLIDAVMYLLAKDMVRNGEDSN